MKIFSMLFLSLSIIAITGCQEEAVTEKPATQVTESQKKQEKLTTSQPVYKVAIDSNYAPFEFKNETGNVVGYDIELIQAIAKEEGFDVELMLSDFDELLPAIDSEKHDIAISAMKLNESRQKKFLASEPYFQTYEGYVVKKSSSFQSVDDIKGHKVAVLGDSHLHEKLELDKSTEIITKPTVFLAFQAIFTGTADAVYSEEPILHFEASQFPDNPVRFIHSKSHNEGHPETNKYVIYTNKNNQELMLKINRGLKTLKENGKYHELTQKWFGDYSTEVEQLL